MDYNYKDTRILKVVEKYKPLAVLISGKARILHEKKIYQGQQDALHNHKRVNYLKYNNS